MPDNTSLARKIIFVIFSTFIFYLALVVFYYFNPPGLKSQTYFILFPFSATSFSKVYISFLSSIFILSTIIVSTPKKVTGVSSKLLWLVLVSFIVQTVSAYFDLIPTMPILWLLPYILTEGGLLFLLQKIYRKMNTLKVILFLVILFLMSLYPTYIIFSDFNSSKVSALDFNFLNTKLETIVKSGNSFEEISSEMYNLNLCSGFVNQNYTEACQRKQNESIEFVLGGLISKVEKIPQDYCLHEIHTIENGTIIEYSQQYWSGLNLCYKTSARTESDCEKIDTDLLNTSGTNINWENERLLYTDLKQTCLNLIRGGGKGSDLN